MMGQATCGTGAVPERPPRCRWGSATEHPCPREATETSWHDVGAEPTTCAEHFVAGEIGREEDGSAKHASVEQAISLPALWSGP
jgi:hypothetical protein